jgi:hypothetical protein
LVLLIRRDTAAHVLQQAKGKRGQSYKSKDESVPLVLLLVSLSWCF